MCDPMKLLLTSLQQHANIQEHAKALGQKYMGINAQTQAEQVFKAPYIADGTHPVPVTNFLNAQCKLRIRGTRHSAPLGSR